jgi:hypothetical protein
MSDRGLRQQTLRLETRQEKDELVCQFDFARSGRFVRMAALFTRGEKNEFVFMSKELEHGKFTDDDIINFLQFSFQSIGTPGTILIDHIQAEDTDLAKYCLTNGIEVKRPSPYNILMKGSVEKLLYTLQNMHTNLNPK